MAFRNAEASTGKFIPLYMYVGTNRVLLVPESKVFEKFFKKPKKWPKKAAQLCCATQTCVGEMCNLSYCLNAVWV